MTTTEQQNWKVEDHGEIHGTVRDAVNAAHLVALSRDREGRPSGVAVRSGHGAVVGYVFADGQMDTTEAFDHLRQGL